MEIASFALALMASGIASTVLAQIAGLKREVDTLKGEIEELKNALRSKDKPIDLGDLKNPSPEALGRALGGGHKEG
jgi:hypothetical protein